MAYQIAQDVIMFRRQGQGKKSTKKHRELIIFKQAEKLTDALHNSDQSQVVFM